MASLAKNTTYYTAALTFQRVLAFVYFTLMARALGPEDLGKYITALSFTAVFVVLADVGLSSLATREVAKDREHAREHASRVLSIKLPLSLVVYALIAAAAQFMEYEETTKRVVYLAGLVMLLDSYSTTFWGILRGLKTIKWESMGVIFFQLILVCIGGTLLYAGQGIVMLALALLCASAWQFAYSFFKMKKAIGGGPLSLGWNTATARSLIAVSFPFALAGIFTRMYTSLDTVLVSKMISETAVGWYSIPVKIILSLQYLPMAFVASLYPAMSEAFAHDSARLEMLFMRAMRYLLAIGVPISLGIAALAQPLIQKIWGDQYLPAVLPLRVIIMSLLIVFVSFPLGSLLNAANRQLANTKHIGAMLVVNVALNLFMIPKWGIIGAAYASSLSSLLLFILNYGEARKVIMFRQAALLIFFIKALISSMIMAGSVWALRDASLFMSVPTGGFVYLLCMAACGGIMKEDIKMIKSIIKKSEITDSTSIKIG